MKINIKGHEIELMYRMRAYLKYEAKEKKSVTYDGMTSFTGISELLYCIIVGTLEHRKYRDLGITFTWEDFLDWTDDQNPNKIVEEFNKFLMDQQRESSGGEISDENTEERDPN